MTIHLDAAGRGVACGRPEMLFLMPLSAGREAEDAQGRVDAEQDDGDAAYDEDRVEQAAAVEAGVDLGAAQVPDGHHQPPGERTTT